MQGDVNSQKFSLAIDGTAASGKSTVAKLLAERLNCSYLDTGKLYRAVALWFLQHLGSQPESWGTDHHLEETLHQMSLRMEAPPRGECRILLHDADVNERLSDLHVERATPFAARIPLVREHLLDVQRDLAKTSSVVMAGRDIGTVVLPNATLKVFIEADLTERARRRLSQHKDTFTEDELKKAADALGARDASDANRKHAPMRAATDSLQLDSTRRTPQQLVDEIAHALQSRLEEENCE